MSKHQINHKSVKQNEITMRRLFGIILGMGVAAMTLVSCSEDNPQAVSAVFEEDINSAATADVIFEDVDDVADYGSDYLDSQGLKMGNPDRHSDCAEVSREELDGVVTIVIDFGDEGCEGKDGRFRMGKILMTVTGEKGQPGHTRTMTFDDFSVDSIGVEGLRTVTNISETESEKKYSITMVGGKLTFPDETEMTRESDRVRTVYYNEELEVFEATVYGTTDGINKDVLTYHHEVDMATPLLYTRACREISRVAPVSGILLIQVESESDKTIDFGDGNCDNIVTVTQDGVSEEIEIDPKQRRRRRFRN